MHTLSREQDAGFVTGHQDSHTFTGSLAPQPFAGRGEEKCSLPGKGMNMDRMGDSHSSTDWISWRNFWRVKGFLLGRRGTGLSVSTSYKQVYFILQENTASKILTQWRFMDLSRFWGQRHANTKEQNLRVLSTTAKKKLILFQLSSVRGRHDQPRLLHLIYVLMINFFCQLLFKCSTSLQTPYTLHLMPQLHVSSPQIRVSQGLPTQIVA